MMNPPPTSDDNVVETKPDLFSGHRLYPRFEFSRQTGETGIMRSVSCPHPGQLSPITSHDAMYVAAASHSQHAGFFAEVHSQTMQHPSLWGQYSDPSGNFANMDLGDPLDLNSPRPRVACFSQSGGDALLYGSNKFAISSKLNLAMDGGFRPENYTESRRQIMAPCGEPMMMDSFSDEEYTDLLRILQTTQGGFSEDSLSLEPLGDALPPKSGGGSGWTQQGGVPLSQFENQPSSNHTAQSLEVMKHILQLSSTDTIAGMKIRNKNEILLMHDGIISIPVIQPNGTSGQVYYVPDKKGGYKIQKRLLSNYNVKKTQKCPQPGCTKIYSSNNSLRNHIRMKHTDKANKLMNADDSSSQTSSTPNRETDTPVESPSPGNAAQSIRKSKSSTVSVSAEGPKEPESTIRLSKSDQSDTTPQFMFSQSDTSITSDHSSAAHGMDIDLAMKQPGSPDPLSTAAHSPIESKPLTPSWSLSPIIGSRTATSSPLTASTLPPARSHQQALKESLSTSSLGEPMSNQSLRRCSVPNLPYPLPHGRPHTSVKDSENGDQNRPLYKRKLMSVYTNRAAQLAQSHSGGISSGTAAPTHNRLSWDMARSVRDLYPIESEGVADLLDSLVHVNPDPSHQSRIHSMTESPQRQGGLNSGKFQSGENAGMPIQYHSQKVSNPQTGNTDDDNLFLMKNLSSDELLYLASAINEKRSENRE